MVGITEQYYASGYLVRTYAIDAFGNVIYGDTAEFDVYSVVEAIKNNSYASDEDIAAADEVIAKAVTADAADSSVVTYAEWLAAKAAQ